jgi:hypothetical protein
MVLCLYVVANHEMFLLPYCTTNYFLGRLLVVTIKSYLYVFASHVLLPLPHCTSNRQQYPRVCISC